MRKCCCLIWREFVATDSLGWIFFLESELSLGSPWRSGASALKILSSCHPERRGLRESEVPGVEGPLPVAHHRPRPCSQRNPSTLTAFQSVGVLRLRESARAERIHYTQDDRHLKQQLDKRLAVLRRASSFTYMQHDALQIRSLRHIQQDRMVF